MKVDKSAVLLETTTLSYYQAYEHGSCVNISEISILNFRIVLGIKNNVILWGKFFTINALRQLFCSWTVSFEQLQLCV
jgi:hypothetical protein